MSQIIPHTELIERLKQGDKEAYKTIFEAYWLSLFEYAARKIKAQEDAREVVQIVFLELWENRSDLRNIHLDHFLKVCIRNKCVDHIRKKILQGKYTEHCMKYSDIADRETQSAISVGDISRQVELGLGHLPEKSRRIFRLSRFEGYSTREIAKEIQLSEKSVEYHLTKALKVMRVCLKDFVLALILITIVK